MIVPQTVENLDGGYLAFCRDTEGRVDFRAANLSRGRKREILAGLLPSKKDQT